ncbi:adenine phosphoribosyltransferase [Candidatus Bathyarchaeota archaeon]|nr:adenine phosphoribosyltransferase [Candidatus Bathyarchaeota archaeon]
MGEDALDLLRELKENLLNATILRFPAPEGGYYNYIVNFLTEGLPEIPPTVLWGCAIELARIADLDGVNKLVTPEAMGIHVTTVLSILTGIPMNVIRRRKYGLPGEIEIVKRTGYAESKMYANGLKAGDRVVLVDSIISTGGTYTAIIQALEKRGVIVQDAVAVIEKPDYNGVSYVEKETQHRVKTLVKVVIKNGRPVLID